MIMCDFEEAHTGRDGIDDSEACEANAQYIIYQELRGDDIGEENPFDMLGAGTVFACGDHKNLMVQEILADGLGSGVGLFVITIDTVEQVR